MKSKTRAIIFDLDGVLLNSESAHTGGYLRALAPFGITSIDYRSIAGMRTEEAVRQLLVAGGIPTPPDVIERVTAEKRAWARKLVEESAPLMEGCVEVLHALHSRYLIALATSSSPQNVEAFLLKSGCGSLFKSILTGNDVKAAKPSPEIYLTALQALGIPPEDALVIEDAPNGVQAAQGAGISVVGITGLLRRSDLEQLKVCHIIDGLNELEPLLL